MTQTLPETSPAAQPETSQPATAQPATGQAVATQTSAPNRRALRPLLLDLAVPLASYYLLRKFGFNTVTSLALSAVVPAVHSVTGLVRNRKVNGLAILIVTVNMMSIAVSFWSGNARIMLAKDGAVTSTIGIAILISVLAGRPLMTTGLHPFIVKGNAAKAAAFDRLKATSARFRKLERLFSVVWGIVLLVDCALRAILAFTLPIGMMVWLSTVITMGSIGVGIVVGSFCSMPMEKMVRLEATATR